MDRTHADDERAGTADPAREPPPEGVERLDRERALDHKLDRIAPSRRAVWPKDDRRSSARVPRSAEEPEPPAAG